MRGLVALLLISLIPLFLFLFAQFLEAIFPNPPAAFMFWFLCMLWIVMAR